MKMNGPVIRPPFRIRWANLAGESERHEPIAAATPLRDG
jgi:hypothetical protein